MDKAIGKAVHPRRGLATVFTSHSKDFLWLQIDKTGERFFTHRSLVVFIKSVTNPVAEDLKEAA